MSESTPITVEQEFAEYQNQITKLEQQLAAAVEALKRAQTQANGNITGCGTCATIRVELGIALAKIGEGKRK